MSVYEDRRRELEEYEFRMGMERGRLAVTLDLLTDAMVLVGQHGVYCQSARQPGKPAMDVQLIDRSLADAKELIASVMAELKKKERKLEAFQKRIPLFFAPDRGVGPMSRHHDCSLGQRQQLGLYRT